jgi:glycosyltransferase involved in cell wall biosynthesis
MNVIYDISVLGMGHIMPKSRTGVFRVIENVAEQLVLHQECSITFCSNMSHKALEYSLSYLDSSKILSGNPISKPPFFDVRSRALNKRNELITLINGGSKLSQLRKLKIKWKIRELLVIDQMCALYNNDFINPMDVKNAEIYHSPFLPLPEKKSSGKYKNIFLTCYDLIPILFPQYCEQGIIDLIKNVLNSITYETWILCISEATRNDLLNYMGNNINPERVIVTELAASETFYQSTNKDLNFKVRMKHDIPDKQYILSVCTLEPRKNIDQVIRAFARLIIQENIKDLNLVLVGSKGWMLQEIFNEIENSAILKDKVIITGYVADEDLAALYSDALFFVYPSFYEGFGLPPLEAMKCGVPVITSNTSSLPEVVGNAGIMVSPTDLDELCQAMLFIYKNPSLREKMVEQSLQRAGKFSWQRCGNETVDAYKASLKY